MQTFLEGLKRAIHHQLPGEESHLEVSPVGRKKSSEALLEAVSPRESAVAVVLFENQGIPSTFLIERSKYNGSHSGQIAFPGGKMDDTDQSLVYTAQRECYEEIGIPASALSLIGELTPVYIPVSNFRVQPYLFWLPDVPKLQPNPHEVVDVFDFPITRLMENCLFRSTIRLNEKISLKDVPYFDIQGRVVWGATALMLNEIRVLIKNNKLL